MGHRVAERRGLEAKEVLGYVEVGSGGRVHGTGVQGPLGAVGAARAGGHGSAGLPLGVGGGRGGAVGASEDGEDAVLLLGGGGGDAGRAGSVNRALLAVGMLLLLGLQERLFWREEEREGRG